MANTVVRKLLSGYAPTSMKMVSNLSSLQMIQGRDLQADPTWGSKHKPGEKVRVVYASLTKRYVVHYGK